MNLACLLVSKLWELGSILKEEEFGLNEFIRRILGQCIFFGSMKLKQRHYGIRMRHCEGAGGRGEGPGKTFK